jgi:gliding motility-associated-like protein
VVANRHTIISNPGGGVDPFGLFPVNCPNGSGYSIRLGNSNTGKEAEGASYEFTIPASASQYSLVYQYAVVFQESNHIDNQRPRFNAKVFNVTNNSYISCASFEYVAYSTIPGFQTSTVKNDVVYKSWTPVTINLSGLAGQTIRLEFTTADCTQGGHFGYAYIDVNTGCSTPILGSKYCTGDSSVTLTAPFGYESYRWFNDNFTQQLGSQSTLTLSPVPPSGNVYAVEITPYAEYGCKDTIFTTVTANATPISNAGNDRAFCNNQQVQIGTNSNSSYAYSWSPTIGLSNPTISNPFASPPVATNYIVTTTDINNGCKSKDTVLVTPSIIDTSLAVNGKFIYCGDETINTMLTTIPTSSIQWYQNNSIVSGINSNNYTVSTPGTYYAILSNNEGCTDSTRKVDIQKFANPDAQFNLSNAAQCIINNNFQFTNTSTASTNTLSYIWQFGDGTTSTTVNPTHSYTNAGSYAIQLVANNGFGCRDTATTTATVYPQPIADFNFDSYCVNATVRFTNATNANGSASVSYLWNLGNNITSTLVSPTNTYSTAGSYTIQLQATSTGCSNYPNIKTKTLNVVQPAKGIRYNPVNAIINKPITLQARGFGTTWLWEPSTYLDNTTIAAPIFQGGSKQQYTIDIISAGGCLTTDTLLVNVNKEVAIHVPSAFTPNGDGQNDWLFPFLTGIKTLVFFRVLNRWGNVVYQSATDLPGWDGVYKGVPQPMDGYVWEAEAIDIDGNKIRRKGNVTLIR